MKLLRIKRQAGVWFSYYEAMPDTSIPFDVRLWEGDGVDIDEFRLDYPDYIDMRYTP